MDLFRLYKACKKRPALTPWVILPIVIPSLASGAEQPDTGDTAWVLMSSALVMFMIPGLAFFYSGMVRSKNVLSSIMHSMVSMGIIGVQWMVIGYSLAFGEGNSLIGGFSHVFLKGISTGSIIGTIPSFVFVWFQGMFAILTPALISGAVAERIKFSSYCVFLLLWATLVYDPVAHWVWGGGWLQKMEALDFAGGTVVHLTSGVSALAIVAVLRNRIGFPREAFLPHNLTLTVLGCALLWFGWLGFNAGSALGANGTAGLALCTTMTASCGAALSWIIMEWMLLKKPSALGFSSGAIAGLVAITPAAGFVTPFWALIIGLAAGVVCYYGVRLKYALRLDDSLDVVGIHGIGGMFGALATGAFAGVGATGLIHGNVRQMAVQILAAVSVALYCYVMTYLLARVVDFVMGLRVSEEAEINGLDKELHGESGYHFF
ncbi:ammonium transporter [Thermodesulforhabdus norvegica]|uniref:Ammonium transporter n=1 Tax=Thermodesulforhabdus norvegica TaxID=39841 RepID=A0A1I4VK08_9BACT|nr:ammonium transporter [Thermodesulforhabdus norvegica]SFN01503.1 ammonium transporter [Thermodesulforhabdus norvegica]